MRTVARKPTDTVKLQLRFSEALRRRLERAATVSDQSMNSEIVRRLEASFRREEKAELILEAIDRTLKALGISNDPRTWSPEMHAWAAEQSGLLGLSRYLPEAQPSENPTESASTDKEKDSK